MESCACGRTHSCNRCQRSVLTPVCTKCSLIALQDELDAARQYVDHAKEALRNEVRQREELEEEHRRALVVEQKKWERMVENERNIQRELEKELEEQRSNAHVNQEIASAKNAFETEKALWGRERVSLLRKYEEKAAECDENVATIQHNVETISHLEQVLQQRKNDEWRLQNDREHLAEEVKMLKERMAALRSGDSELEADKEHLEQVVRALQRTIEEMKVEHEKVLKSTPPTSSGAHSLVESVPAQTAATNGGGVEICAHTVDSDNTSCIHIATSDGAVHTVTSRGLIRTIPNIIGGQRVRTLAAVGQQIWCASVDMQDHTIFVYDLNTKTSTQLRDLQSVACQKITVMDRDVVVVGTNGTMIWYDYRTMKKVGESPNLLTPVPDSIYMGTVDHVLCALLWNKTTLSWVESNRVKEIVRENSLQLEKNIQSLECKFVEAKGTIDLLNEKLKHAEMNVEQQQSKSQSSEQRLREKIVQLMTEITTLKEISASTPARELELATLQESHRRDHQSWSAERGRLHEEQLHLRNELSDCKNKIASLSVQLTQTTTTYEHRIADMKDEIHRLEHDLGCKKQHESVNSSNVLYEIAQQRVRDLEEVVGKQESTLHEYRITIAKLEEMKLHQSLSAALLTPTGVGYPSQHYYVAHNHPQVLTPPFPTARPPIHQNIQTNMDQEQQQHPRREPAWIIDSSSSSNHQSQHDGGTMVYRPPKTQVVSSAPKVRRASDATSNPTFTLHR